MTDPKPSLDQLKPKPQTGKGKDKNEDENVPQFARLNPQLLRIHADDQDKKTICIFWTVLFVFCFFIAVVSNFAIPRLYETQYHNILNSSNVANCTFPSIIINAGKELGCGNYNTQNMLTETIFGWSPVNQFILQYLQVVPLDINKPINFSTNITITVFQIQPFFLEPENRSHIRVLKQLQTVNGTFQFDSSSANPMYAKDGVTLVGYDDTISVLTNIKSDMFVQIKFDKNIANGMASLELQSYAINRQFTNYMIIVRQIFVILSIVALSLYFLRFCRIPKEKRTIQQLFVAIMSILLVMFNDPFYPITVLIPNGGSAFFSILFVVNLIVFLIFVWLVTADRINFQDGEISTEQLTKKKIAYVIVIWIELIVCMMVYTMQQINTVPILTKAFQSRFIIARVIIAITIAVSIVYIAFRYVRICMNPQSKLWRSYIFMVFSSIFIIFLFILIVSNSFMPFNLEGSAILLVYGLINIYVFYLQYMYTITKEEAQKIDGKISDVQDIEMISDATIDIVDVDLGYSQKQALHPKEKSKIFQQFQDSEMPANKKSNYQKFDFE